MDTTASPAPAAVRSQPPTRPRRLPLLDVLRGIAILGTLGTNIWIFASPSGEAGPLLGFAATDDTPLGAVFEFAANGKFLSMLTILFGVGLAIQFSSAERHGRRWPGRYYWRPLFLFAEGTIHFVLIFAWDVLMGYAATALVVAWILARSKGFRRFAMWASLGLHLTVLALLTGAMFTGPGSDPQSDPEVEALYASGSWWEQVQFRLDNALAFRIEPIVTFPLLVFLFLLGVSLFRAGAFDGGERGRLLRRRLAIWGLGIGAPLTAALMAGPDELFFLERYAAAPVLALGYMGLIGIVAGRIRRGPVQASLESLGRTALSGYILQNLAAAALCYGWGLGLAHRFEGQAWLPPVLWLVISAALLVGSRLWLRRFSTGPAELLQKRLLR